MTSAHRRLVHPCFTAGTYSRALIKRSSGALKAPLASSENPALRDRRQASMSAVIEAEAVPPGIEVTVSVADTIPAPFVSTCTSMGQLPPTESDATQPFPAIEKSVPA